MDYFDLFLIALLVGAVLFFLPGIISARQSKKEKQLEALEKQTEEENARTMLEINSILDNENDPRADEQVSIHICCSYGYVNVTDKILCTNCNNSLAIQNNG